MAKKIFYYDEHLNDEDLNARIYTQRNGNHVELFRGFLLSDTLKVNIKNDWGDQTGFLVDVQKKAKEVGQSILDTGRQINQVTGGKVGEYTGTTESLNSKLVSASDYYKSFRGTNISYPDLEIIYYDITDTSNKDITGRFASIISSFAGNFSINKLDNGLSGRTTAPNNFTMPLTFNSEIPGSYSIKTRAATYKKLLCNNISYEISPQRTQNNKPLYIIARFSFINGSIVTLDNLITDHIK